MILNENEAKSSLVGNFALKKRKSLSNFIYLFNAEIQTTCIF